MCGPTEFSLTGTLKDYNCVDKLGNIHTPMLIMAGEYNEVCPPTAEYYQSLIPGSELAVFPGCGHLTMQDDSASYVQRLRDFLNKVVSE